MASSLFRSQPRNNPLAQIMNIKKTMDQISKGNADAIAEQMAKSNPAFAQFVSDNKGKSEDEILRSYGISPDDFHSVLNMLKR